MNYFTYVCANDRGVRRRRWHNADPVKGRGLYFYSDEIKFTPEVMKTLADHPVVLEFIGKPAIVLPYEDGAVVTQAADFIGRPDDADADTQYLVQLGTGSIGTINLRDRFNACTYLVKNAIGCHACDELGIKCMSQAFPGTEIELGNHSHDDDSTREMIERLFVHGKTKVGDFTYASPAMTKVDDFAPMWRAPDAHDFERIEAWTATRREAAAKAAKGRRFKKEQCSKCFISNRCAEYRHCEGAYTPEDGQTQAALEQWLPRLASMSMPAWQFWAVSHLAGRHAVHRRFYVMLSGIKHRYGDKFEFAIHYRRRYAHRETWSGDYAELAELFGLPTTEDQARRLGMDKAPENKQLLAMYLDSLGHSYGASELRGWAYKRRDVTYRRVDGSRLVLGWGSDNYADSSWCVYLNSWGEYWKELGSLPAPKIAAD